MYILKSTCVYTYSLSLSSPAVRGVLCCDGAGSHLGRHLKDAYPVLVGHPGTTIAAHTICKRSSHDVSKTFPENPNSSSQT